jgi:hypothetical protein
MFPYIMGITLEDFIQEVEGVQLADIPRSIQQTINEALSDTNSEVYGPEKSELSPCTPNSIADAAMQRKSVYNEFKKLYSPQKQEEDLAEEVFPNLTDLVSKSRVVSAVEEAQSLRKEVKKSTASFILQAGYNPTASGSVTSPGPGGDGAEEARQVLEVLAIQTDRLINFASELSSDVQNVFTPVLSDSDGPKQELQNAFITELGVLDAATSTEISSDPDPPIVEWSEISFKDYNSFGIVTDDGANYIREIADATLKALNQFRSEIRARADKCSPEQPPSDVT